MYGVVPPVISVLMLPLAAPLQVTLLTESPAKVNVAGWIIVTVAVAVQLCASVTVTVYGPAAAVIFCVVAVLLHRYV